MSYQIINFENLERTDFLGQMSCDYPTYFRKVKFFKHIPLGQQPLVGDLKNINDPTMLSHLKSGKKYFTSCKMRLIFVILSEFGIYFQF